MDAAGPPAGSSPGPLAGRRVVVTRPADQAGPLVELLEAAGATAIVAPLVEIVDDRAELDALAATDVRTFDWVVVTSANAARRLLAAHGELFRDAGRDPGHPALAAVGTATAAVLGPCRLVPAQQNALGLLAEMPDPHGGRRVLVVQATEAAATLVDGLRAAGWDVDVRTPYRSAPARPPAAAQLAALAADAVLFTSGSAARSWVAVFGTSTPPVTVAMGPQTAAAAREAGIPITVTADDHSLAGLVAAAARVLGPSAGQ